MMNMLFAIAYLVVIYISGGTSLSESEYVHSKVNVCLDSKHHKSQPGPEDALHQQCDPWKKNSCCRLKTSEDVHTGNLYNFNYNHCQPMSPACLKRFRQDHCFYECSPNIGPWIVKEDREWRKERYYKVPLCASDCDTWYEDCKHDFSCTLNWSRNFNWVNGENVCHNISDCQTIEKLFGSAKSFCEKVWDYAWAYTAPTEHCMRLWFNGSAGNPNVAVADWKAKEDFKNFKFDNSPSSSKLIYASVTQCIIAGFVILFLNRSILIF